MNFLVIGGTGFMGRETCLLLAAEGHAVRAYSPSAGRTDLPSSIVGITGLIADKGEMTKQIEWADNIIHLVSTTNPKTSFSDPHHDLSSNLLPMVQLLDLLKSFPTKKIIFCSSGGAVYGPTETFPISENHPKHPATSYGMVKSAMEDYIEYYHKNYGIPYLVVRPSNVYGPKLRSIGEQGIISTLLFNALKESETNLWANPHNIRDYIFISDFAEGLVSLIKANAEGVFNLGNGKGYSLNEIIAAVQEVVEKPLKINFGEKAVRDEPANVLDISKIHQLTGWQPVTALATGIRAINDQLLVHLKHN